MTETSAPATARIPGDSPRTASRLYRTVWRWHFYAGLLVAPIVLVAASTGALYVFRAELEPWLYPGLLSVTPPANGEMLSYEQQLEAAQKVAPREATLSFVGIPGTEQARTPHVTQFFFLHPGNTDQRRVFVDPWTGRVTGHYDRSGFFFDIVLRIHRRLFLGSPGRVLVELATCWGIVLVVTGLYLWWPRSSGNRGGVWTIRTGRSWYMTLRDLHAVPAACFSGVFLFIMSTGLFFSYAWGTGFRLTAASTGGFPTEVLAPPLSQIPEEGGQQTPSRISIDHAVAAARKAGFTTETLSVGMPQTPTASLTVSTSQKTGASLNGMLYLDQYSGETLVLDRGENVPLMTAALLYALPIHQGSIFGWPTRVLAFVAALVLTITSATGLLMWWKRRPTGQLGLPRRQRDVVVPRWMKLLAVVLCICLPVTGLSLGLILLADRLVQRRGTAL